MAETMVGDEELFGATAQEWVDRWDAGRSVWSVEMGGLGPGYEQCIQTMAVEMLRWMLTSGEPVPEPHEDRKAFEIYGAMMDKDLGWLMEQMGPSGAQWGAARNIASVIYRHGPAKALRMVEDDRHIQVSRDFPSLAAPTT